MNKKSIVLTRFPFTDLSSSKRRPVVILTKTDSTKTDVIVAFISSVIPSELSSTDFVLNNLDTGFTQTGLSKTSVFKMDKLATLDKSIFTGEMGEVSDDIFIKLVEKLKIALEL